MGKHIIFRAGKKALSKIRDNGLDPESIKVIAGAAGGPKWLILGHLDRFLFTAFFQYRQEPLFLMGSSSAAWRFAAAAQADPVAAIGRFQDAYINQSYNTNPTPAQISLEAGKILKHLLKGRGAAEILSHPFLRLNFMTVRCRGLTGSETRLLLLAGLGMAVFGNFIHRRLLGLFFERGLFFDPRDIPPFASMNDLPMTPISLTTANLEQGLLASGSIPWVMSGIKGIPEAPAGIYRDGGVTDYQMDIPFLDQQEGIVLFPHYSHRIIPGWFDKMIPWRKPNPSNMENVLLLAPSPSFVGGLPGGKIPDRNDFYTYKGRDNDRLADWNRAVDLSRQLADEFIEAVDSGRIRKEVQPLAFS